MIQPLPEAGRRWFARQKWFKDLLACGMTLDQYRAGQYFFYRNGVSVGPKRDRSDRYTGEFTWLGIPDAGSDITATAVCCKCSPAVLVEMFWDQEATLRQFGKTKTWSEAIPRQAVSA